MSAKELTEKYDDLKKGKKLLADIEAQLQEWVSSTDYVWPLERLFRVVTISLIFLSSRGKLFSGLNIKV